MPKLAKKKSIEDQLQNRCVAAAKAVMSDYGKIMAESAKYEHELAGGDPWGPSVADMHDANDMAIYKLSRIIYKHMKKEIK